MRSKERIPWLDLVKGVAIMGVVMGHSITQGIAPFIDIHHNILPLAYMLFIFVMPAFFAVSGYLYKYERIQSLKDLYIFIYKKISSFLIPYITFTFIVFIMNQIHNINHGVNINYLIINNFLKEFFFSPSYLWFLYALFIIFIITGIMDFINLNFYIQFLFYLLLLFIQLHFSWQVGNSAPAGICSFGIFFWMGEFINTHSKLINKLYTFLSILFILTFTFLMYYLCFIRSSVLDINNVFFVNLIPKLLSVPFVFQLCQLMDRHRCYLILYFENIGKYTLIIYLSHFYVVRLTGKILLHITRVSVIDLIIIFTISWLLSIFICKLSRKYKLLNFIFYTRGYINKFIKHTRLGEKLGIR